MIVEMGIAPEAVVDETALTALLDLMRDAARFWSERQVRFYFLVHSSHGDLASLSSVPAFPLDPPAVDG